MVAVAMVSPSVFLFKLDAPGIANRHIETKLSSLLLVERRDQSLLFHIRFLRVLVFGEFLQHFEHAGPASGVIPARNRQLCETAVRDFYQRSSGLGSKFPAHDSATRYVVVTIRD